MKSLTNQTLNKILLIVILFIILSFLFFKVILSSTGGMLFYETIINGFTGFQWLQDILHFPTLVLKEKTSNLNTLLLSYSFFYFLFPLFSIISISRLKGEKNKTIYLISLFLILITTNFFSNRTIAYFIYIALLTFENRFLSSILKGIISVIHPISHVFLVHEYVINKRDFIFNLTLLIFSIYFFYIRKNYYSAEEISIFINQTHYFQFIGIALCILSCSVKFFNVNHFRSISDKILIFICPLFYLLSLIKSDFSFSLFQFDVKYFTYIYSLSLIYHAEELTNYIFHMKKLISSVFLALTCFLLISGLRTYANDLLLKEFTNRKTNCLEVKKLENSFSKYIISQFDFDTNYYLILKNKSLKNILITNENFTCDSYKNNKTSFLKSLYLRNTTNSDLLNLD